MSDKVRELKGVPLLYIAYQAIHLENPSQRTLHHAQHNKSQKIKLSDYQKSFISELKKATFGEVRVFNYHSITISWYFKNPYYKKNYNYNFFLF